MSASLIVVMKTKALGWRICQLLLLDWIELQKKSLLTVENTYLLRIFDAPRLSNDLLSCHEIQL